jgi:hypothetical protein
LAHEAAENGSLDPFERPDGKQAVNVLAEYANESCEAR